MTTFVCAAPGPSLDAADLARCVGRVPVLCVGDAWRLAPWCEHVYHADARWWRRYGAEVEASCAGDRWMPVRAFDPAAAEEDLRCVLAFGLRFKLIRPPDRAGLSLDPDVLHHGLGSGFQAVNLARHLGATRVLLLGYDMSGGHFFGEHPPELRRSTDWPRMREQMATIRGLDVVNCTRGGALTGFPRASLLQALG